ncbi:MAG TPA: ParB-like protein [Caulobacteraceae bacterium]|nr:ParB-like protein [Caulobacteraceae bacterium]
MIAREPILSPVAIAELRPTQITVGFREVAEKWREWSDRSEKSGKKAAQFLGSHLVPTVLGPSGRHYLIDHHHLALALQQAKQTEVLVTVAADLSSLPRAAFWTYLDNRALCHPYDAAGKRRSFDDIPKRIADLADDPYRSLAGELRRVGGFAKDTTPFSEFLWADFLRPRVKAKQINEHFPAALERALALSKTEAATYLPGWCGPHPD